MYLLKCADGTFYTGITTDSARRVHEHNESVKGAKYTKARRPVVLVYEEVCISRSEAQKKEYELRHRSHAEQQTLSDAFATGE